MKWGLIDFLVVGPIMARIVYGLVGVPLGQALTLNRHPLRAALLRGSLSAMVLTGAGVRSGQIWIVAALLAPLPYLMFVDPCLYYGGHRYGRALINYLGQSDPRWKKRLARGERAFARYSSLAVFLAQPIWLLPADVIYFLAGETGMKFRKFIVLDFLGTVVWVAQVVALGYFIGKPAEDLAAGLSKYTWLIIGGEILVILAISLPSSIRRARAEEARRRDGQESPSEDG